MTEGRFVLCRRGRKLIRTTFCELSPCWIIFKNEKLIRSLTEKNAYVITCHSLHVYLIKKTLALALK